MEQVIGVVKEVHIPTKDNNDVMFSNKVGFKVETDKETFNIEEDQNEENALILKNDKVLITKQIISGKEFIDIEKHEGEDYE